MKKSWKIALWTCSGLLLTTSSVFPIVGCSFSSKYQPSDDVTSNPSFTFKNQGINYYSGVKWQDSVDWAKGIADILIDQGKTESSNNGKLSTWNKNVNEKLFTNDIDNNLLKGNKVSMLYMPTVEYYYKDALLDFNNMDLFWSILTSIFDEIKKEVEAIKKTLEESIKKIINNIIAKIKEQIKDAQNELIEKLLKKLEDWFLTGFDFPSTFSNSYALKNVKNNSENKSNKTELFPNISPILEDEIYNSKKLNQEQKDAYKSFNFMNDHLNIESGYLFDRYLLIHEFNSLIYKQTYENDELNFIKIKNNDFFDAFIEIVTSFGANWKQMVKVILYTIVGSIPITFEAMLLEDLYTRISRWYSPDDPNSSNNSYKAIYEEIDKRLNTDLLPMLNKWISNSFGIFNQKIDINDYFPINDIIFGFFDEFLSALAELGIDNEDINKMIDDLKANFKDLFIINLNIDLGYLYKKFIFKISGAICVALSNSKFNILSIYQTIIDWIATLGSQNLDKIEQLVDWIANLGNKLINLIDELNNLLNWIDNVSKAIKKDEQSENPTGLREKVFLKVGEILPLLKDFKTNKDEIVNKLKEIDEMAKEVLKQEEK